MPEILGLHTEPKSDAHPVIRKICTNESEQTGIKQLACINHCLNIQVQKSVQNLSDPIPR